MPATNQSTLISIFGDIADAIRNRTSGSSTYHPADMAAAIMGINIIGGGGFNADRSSTSQRLASDGKYASCNSILENFNIVDSSSAIGQLQ